MSEIGVRKQEGENESESKRGESKQRSHLVFVSRRQGGCGARKELQGGVVVMDTIEQARGRYKGTGR